MSTPIIIEKKNKHEPRPKKKDKKIEKYKELNHEINKIVRTILMQLDLNNCKNEKLKPLEIVSLLFLYKLFFNYNNSFLFF